ncbi:unnamed protein product [Euphydryas editha]|uniref:Uncharacterized protein n=1 Tax=Euphydryas editha TaxID=104508 RepID=A0AAU9VE17_EUPED|nr:unnamed protein product [Euphydryas editha]
METILSSDDSSDSDLKSLKNQLSEYGLDEDNLSKEEMIDLLKALKFSKTTIQQEQSLPKNKEDGSSSSTPKIMKRRYLNVKDRRMPWSLIPTTLAPTEKARTLAVYIKLMSINAYRQARQSPNMTAWSSPIQIMESTRIQPHRSTRSGRSVPLYTDFDDDSSDFNCVITKTKKRRTSCNEQNDVSIKKGSLSLKRKLSKDEHIRPIKEAKVITDIQKADENNLKVDIYSLVED